MRISDWSAYVCSSDLNESGAAIVGGFIRLNEAGFFCDLDRRAIVRIDDAAEFGRAQFRLAPADRRLHRFAGIAAAVAPGVEHPAHFRNALDRRGEISVEIGEADVADETVAVPVIDRPIAVAQHRPEAARAQDARPDLLTGEGLAPDVTNDLGIAPHRGGGVEIVRRRRAQEEALGRKDRDAAVTSRHPGECRGLSTRGHDGSLRDPGLRRDDSFGSLLTERETAEALVEARSEEHTSELQSLMRNSYAVFCLKNKTHTKSI